MARFRVILMRGREVFIEGHSLGEALTRAGLDRRDVEPFSAPERPYESADCTHGTTGDVNCTDDDQLVRGGQGRSGSELRADARSVVVMLALVVAVVVVSLLIYRGAM